MKTLLILATLCAPFQAFAQEPVSPEEFEAYAEGHTLYFTRNGQFYGSEQFKENRRTVWRAEDGSCVNGKWAPSDGAMCFIYDDGSGLHCWLTYREDGNIFVQNIEAPDGEEPTLLELSDKDEVPIICTGPSVGV